MEEKGRNKVVLSTILIVLVLLLVAGGIFGGVYLYSSYNKDSNEEIIIIGTPYIHRVYSVIYSGGYADEHILLKSSTEIEYSSLLDLDRFDYEGTYTIDDGTITANLKPILTYKQKQHGYSDQSYTYTFEILDKNTILYSILGKRYSIIPGPPPPVVGDEVLSYLDLTHAQAIEKLGPVDRYTDIGNGGMGVIYDDGIHLGYAPTWLENFPYVEIDMNSKPNCIFLPVDFFTPGHTMSGTKADEFFGEESPFIFNDSGDGDGYWKFYEYEGYRVILYFKDNTPESIVFGIEIWKSN